MHLRRLFALTVLGLAATACTPTVRVTRWKPAEIPTRSGTRVAVLPMSGNDADQLNGEIQRAISEGQFFELVDREVAAQVTAEQRMIIEGLAKNDGSVQMGGVLAAQLLLAGSANVSYNEDVQQSRSTCTRYVNGKAQNYPCTRYTRTGRVRYTANLKVVDTSTSRSIPRNYTKADDDRESSTDSVPPAIDSERLIANCRAAVVRDFMKVIAPYPVTEEIELVKDGDVPQLEQGNAFAKQNNWAAAAQRYGEAVALVSGGVREKFSKPEVRAKAFYALGLSLVMQGNYADGVEQLRQASNLAPEDRYANMLARAMTWKAEADKLATQGAAQTAGTSE